MTVGCFDSHLSGVQSDSNASFQYFKTTRWSVVRQALEADESKAGEALAVLCETYWFPLYAFIRRSGIRPQDAEDLTQGFFCRLVKNNFLAAADPAKGKLRSFLLACVSNHLADERDRAGAQKRGAGVLVSVNPELAERRYKTEAFDNLSPDRLFQRQWALSMLQHTMEMLAQEYDEANKQDIFLALRPFLGFAPAPEKGYEEVSRGLGVPVGTLKSHVHGMRARWCELLFERVGMTLADPTPENIKCELQDLQGYV